MEKRLIVIVRGYRPTTLLGRRSMLKIGEILIGRLGSRDRKAFERSKEVAKQVPAFAVESHHLHIADYSEIVFARVNFGARQ